MEQSDISRLLDKVDRLNDICTGTAVEVTNLKNEVNLLRVFRHDYGNLVQSQKGFEEDIEELSGIIARNQVDIITLKKDIENMSARMLSWKAVGVWVIGTAITVFGVVSGFVKG